MKYIETEIPDVFIIEPSVFEDERGYFLESFNLKKFKKTIHPITFVQDNESKSSKGVVRGLHFQKPPFHQAKLVRCIEGSVLDVAVDIRKGSPTFGKYIAVELSGANKKQLFVPRGFAHGFSVLSETAICIYKVDNEYAPEYDAGIRWNDTSLNINWGLAENEVIVSENDKALPFLNEFDTPFSFNG